MAEIDDENIRFMPFDEVTAARGLVEALHDMWWSVHPERGVIFWKSGRGSRLFLHAQCNQNEIIARQLQAKLYPWAEVRQIPLVLVRRNPGDY